MGTKRIFASFINVFLKKFLTMVLEKNGIVCDENMQRGLEISWTISWSETLLGKEREGEGNSTCKGPGATKKLAKSFSPKSQWEE